MRFEIEGLPPPSCGVRVGNVYPARGGRAGQKGYLYVVVAVTERKPDRFGHDASAGMACCLVVDRDGDIRGTTTYGAHYFEDREPCGFVHGLEGMLINLSVGGVTP
jgi:hypothetical protein